MGVWMLCMRAYLVHCLLTVYEQFSRHCRQQYNLHNALNELFGNEWAMITLYIFGFGPNNRCVFFCI